MLGIVYKYTGSYYWVKSKDNILHRCIIKGKFRTKGIKSTNPIAVGDRVVFELEKKGDEEIGVISKIKKRENEIVRKSVNLSKQTHIIASNVELVFLIITIKNPKISTIFIDRILVSTRAYMLETVLVFNKTDTYSIEETTEVLSLKNIYESIGYKCVEVSAIKNKNTSVIKELMTGKTSIFVGHSGVGKTSLINAIEPSLNLKTKEISIYHKQGQHTTTLSEMHDLSFDARIIDTPGIKGFGIVNIDKYSLSNCFKEFSEIEISCKFNNCLHLKEPECAVKKALEIKKIYMSRYKSYLQIIESEENPVSYRTVN